MMLCFVLGFALTGALVIAAWSVVKSAISLRKLRLARDAADLDFDRQIEEMQARAKEAMRDRLIYEDQMAEAEEKRARKSDWSVN